MLGGRWARLWSEIRRGDRRREVDEELAMHIDLLTERYVEEGLEPAAARRKALRQFGDVKGLAKRVRAIDAGRHRRRRRRELGGAMKLDLRYGWRQVRGSPLMTAAAVLTLALGIGVNVAMFSLLESVVLRELPYPDSDRLVAVWPAKNKNQAMVDILAAETPSLEAVSGRSYWALTMLGDGVEPPEVVTAAVVGLDFFRVLGVRPMVGRTFAPEERTPATSGVVVLTHGFWQRRFGGDRSVIGRVVPLEGYGHAERQIIGVLPPSFRSLHQDPAVYVPLHVPPGRTVATDSSWYVSQTVARLAPGATVEQAASEVGTVAARIRADFPGSMDDEDLARATAVPYRDVLVGDARATLLVLVGAVGLILLIACVNVANLFLVRASRRAGEISLRKALGATRIRVVAQQLTETGILAALGGGAGIALGAGLLAVLEPKVAEQLPRVTELGLNGTVLAFALGVTFLAATLSGLLPALRAASRDAVEGLRSGATSLAGRRRGLVLNRSLVAIELALAVVLVAGAALMVRSVRGIAETDPGFDPDGVIALRVAPPPARYSARDAQRAYQGAVLERLRAVPGAAEVGSIHLLPLGVGNWSFPFLAEGHEPPADGPLPSANFRVVSDGYFEAMRIPVLRGRGFTAADDGAAPDVGVINRAMAEQLWPGQDPVGKVIELFGSSPFTVVGVVGDVRQFSLDLAPQPEMYVPMPQFPLASTIYMVRAEPGLSAASLMPGLRNAVWDIDDDVPVPLLEPMADLVAETMDTDRLVAGLLTGFALLALILGLIGVYGVMAYAVAGRAREFGIRTALGAGPGAVERRALRDAIPALAAGLTIGLLGALAAGRAMESLLYQVEPTDPPTLAGAIIILAATTLLASWLPARRAARAEAAAILRE